jgi:hypothetical protein
MRIMVDKHSQSFFGKSTGMSIQSSSRDDPYIFFKCIQKKQDGTWEKPSIGEGKTIKCNLDEMVMIYEVLNKNLNVWSSYHNFKDVKTQISFKWENEKKERLYINIDKYSKMLNFAQAEILRLLLKHLIKEKIEHATTLNIKKERYSENKSSQSEITVTEERKENESSPVKGTIKGETQKALLINFDDEHKCWIPKSAIKSNYDSASDMNQTFQIDDWLLKRNNILVQ